MQTERGGCDGAGNLGKTLCSNFKMAGILPNVREDLIHLKPMTAIECTVTDGRIRCGRQCARRDDPNH